MKKVKRGISGSTVAIITLTILLLVSIGIGVALAYFSNTANVTGQVTLADPINISITQGGASVSSLEFAENVLPGQIFTQSIGVSAPQDTSTALVRAKVILTSSKGTDATVAEASTTASWKKGTDDYYYYYGTLNENQNIDFISAITIPTSLGNEYANSTMTVQVIVEAIQQANNAVNTVWTTAPTDWINEYSPLPTTSE
ncbi:MAG: hypothetical protein E7374_00605 [Clostridiales bacterium]|nr:hypothetical protein [Clostridiales bacterium]